jgi:hypothetical protein
LAAYHGGAYGQGFGIGHQQPVGALRFDISAVPFADSLIRTRSIPMSPTKLVVAEAEINRRCETARKASDLAGMQQAMTDLTALHRAYYGTPTVNGR